MGPTDLPPPLALRPREAARALGVSARTLWTWTKTGHVPHVRVGDGKRKTTLYPVAELRDWLARNAAPRPAEEATP